jgi:hypothetical protein
VVFPFSTNLPRGGRVVFYATTGSRRADRVKTLLFFGGASSSVHIPFRGGRPVLCGSIPVSFPFFFLIMGFWCLFPFTSIGIG